METRNSGAGYINLLFRNFWGEIFKKERGKIESIVFFVS
jgi:hypothetical protein